MTEQTEPLWKQIFEADSQGHTAKAVHLIKKVMEIEPQDFRAWVTLGVTLRALARYEEALDAFGNAMEFCPKDLTFLVCLDIGMLYDQQGNLVAASGWFHRACVESPQDASPHIYQGEMFAKMGRLAEAEAKHRDATHCATGPIEEGWLNLGLVLRAQERYAEAAEAFREALKIDPDYEVAKASLADVGFFLEDK